MSHLVMDTIFAHAIDVIIAETEIELRRAEWDKLTGRTLSRSDYIKGLLAFCGIELIDYHNARVHRNMKLQRWEIEIRSKYWADRQPH